MKKIFLLPALLSVQYGLCQYYYKDIVSTKQSVSQMQVYKQQNIKGYELTSFEATGVPTKDLEIYTRLNKDFTESRTFTSSPEVGKSMLTVFYSNSGQMTRSIDSTRSFLSTNVFEYDTEGRIVTITNNSNNYDGDFNTVEKHEWQYNGKCPVAMLCIKFGNDTTLIKITCDNNGNPIEEEQIRKKTTQGKIFYYYDEEGRLTDIVRFNNKANKLLPDMMFSYDASGRLSGMLTLQDGNLDYQDWQYQYNPETGLKEKETCYGRRKELLGRVEYNYQK